MVRSEKSNIWNHIFRLENLGSEFCCLNNKANALKTMGLVYKQRFETKRSDLAKAEAEVCNQKHHVFSPLLVILLKNYINYLFVSQSYLWRGSRNTCSHVAK